MAGQFRWWVNRAMIDFAMLAALVIVLAVAAWCGPWDKLREYSAAYGRNSHPVRVKEGETVYVTWDYGAQGNVIAYKISENTIEPNRRHAEQDIAHFEISGEIQRRIQAHRDRQPPIDWEQVARSEGLIDD